MCKKNFFNGFVMKKVASPLEILFITDNTVRQLLCGH